MKIDVEAHSDAKAGSTCTRLTKGRAKNSEKYLRSRGVKNPMGNPRGKCGVKRAIVIASSGARTRPPAGCGITTDTATEPLDPCKRAAAQRKANEKIAAALKSEVRFGGGSTVIKPSGKRTLNKVAKILQQYPWMKIDVEAHSDAQAGRTCTRLTKGRAKNSEKYLRSKGVKNPMGKPKGKCGVKRAIVIKGFASQDAGLAEMLGCGKSISAHTPGSITGSISSSTLLQKADELGTGS